MASTMPERVTVDHLLQVKVGQFGAGQLYILLLAGTVIACQAVVFFIALFMAADPIQAGLAQCSSDHDPVCQSAIKDSSAFCSLAPRELNYTWKDPHYSIVSEYGLVCDQAWKADMVQSISLAGLMVGMLMFGHLADSIGRRLALTCTLAFTALATLLSAVIPSYAAIVVFRAMACAGTGGMVLMAYLLIVECVGPEHRGLASMLIQSFFVVGSCIMVALAYALPNWHKQSYVAAAMTAALLLLQVLLPESPRWLVIKGYSNEAVETLRWLKRLNQRRWQQPLPPQTWNQYKSQVIKLLSREWHSTKSTLELRLSALSSLPASAASVVLPSPSMLTAPVSQQPSAHPILETSSGPVADIQQHACSNQTGFVKEAQSLAYCSQVALHPSHAVVTQNKDAYGHMLHEHAGSHAESSKGAVTSAQISINDTSCDIHPSSTSKLLASTKARDIDIWNDRPRSAAASGLYCNGHYKQPETPSTAGSAAAPSRPASPSHTSPFDQYSHVPFSQGASSSNFTNNQQTKTRPPLQSSPPPASLHPHTTTLLLVSPTLPRPDAQDDQSLANVDLVNATAWEQLHLALDIEASVDQESACSLNHSQLKDIMPSSRKPSADVITKARDGEHAAAPSMPGIPEDKQPQVEASAPPHPEGATIWQIIQNRHSLRVVIVMSYISLFIGLVYYGLTFAAGDLFGSIYLNFFLLSIMELPSYITSALIVDRIGRRWSTAASVCGMGVACMLLAFVRRGPAQLGLAVLGKYAEGIAYSVSFMFSAEVFPTPVRSITSGLIAAAGRLGGIAAPFLVGTDYDAVSFMAMGLMAAVAMVSIMLLPETVGQPQPDNLEDMLKMMNQHRHSLGLGLRCWRRCMRALARETADTACNHTHMCSSDALAADEQSQAAHPEGMT